jgi:hypothetical protein
VLPPDAQRTVIPLCAFRTARCWSTARFRLTPPGLRCGASSPLLWLRPPKPATIRHLADRRPRRRFGRFRDRDERNRSSDAAYKGT